MFIFAIHNHRTDGVGKDLKKKILEYGGRYLELRNFKGPLTLKSKQSDSKNSLSSISASSLPVTFFPKTPTKPCSDVDWTLNEIAQEMHQVVLIYD